MFVANFAASSCTRPPTNAPHPRLARALWQWLALGVLLLLVFPAARGPSLWFGPGAFWLLGAPLASLLMLYRHALAAVWRGILAPAPRRRDGVLLPFSGACNATKLDPLPGGRPLRRQRRSERESSRHANTAYRRKKTA